MFGMVGRDRPVRARRRRAGAARAAPSTLRRMSLDRTLHFVFRNFATLFLLVALVTVPLHVGRAFAFRQVISVREIHPAIAELPPNRLVRNVGASDLDTSRKALLAVIVVELMLIPLMAGAVRRVALSEAAGRLPSVADAWGHSLGAWRRAVPRAGPATVVAGLVLALAVGALAWRIGMIVTEPVGGTVAFVAVGMVEAVSAALAAPFFLAPLALFARSAKGGDPGAPRLTGEGPIA